MQISSRKKKKKKEKEKLWKTNPKHFQQNEFFWNFLKERKLNSPLKKCTNAKLMIKEIDYSV